MFQFLDGAIKRWHTHRPELHRQGFQFLDGAIKSDDRVREAHRALQFQFLDGAIKSLQMFELNLFQFCFNSLMVRLKVL